MFIFSVRSSKFKKIAVVFAAVITVIVLIAVLKGCSAGGTDCEMSTQSERADMSAFGEDGRLKFISSLGWEVNKSSGEMCEVMIPSEFDDVYNEYNKIQISQGTDLTGYAGRTVQKWTYDITNYDGYAPDSGVIKLNLLILDSKVIGGDVCCVELGGFMRSFYKA